MENGNNQQQTFIQKVINFVKKNPALAGTLGTIILWVLGIIVAIILIAFFVHSVISLFSGFFGFKETDLTGSTGTKNYNELSLEELQSLGSSEKSCYEISGNNWFDSTWQDVKDWIIPGYNSRCELIELIRFKVEKAEKKYIDYDLQLSPGLIISTIIYTYGEQIDVEGEEKINSENPTEILQAIVDSKVLDEGDIDEMIDAMIFQNKYYYYTCGESDTLTCTSENGDDEYPGSRCAEKLYLDVYFSREKYEIFLRYGIDVANAYEAAINHNMSSAGSSCKYCYEKMTKQKYGVTDLDTEKYLQVADYDGDNSKQDDNISIVFDEEEYEILQNEINKINANVPSLYDYNFVLNPGDEYNYTNGYIFTRVPIYQEEIVSFHTPKTIEKSIQAIIDHEDTENQIYGMDELKEGSKGKENSEYKVNYSSSFCANDGYCDCNKNSLFPENFYDKDICTFLADGNKEANIRLVSCPGETDYATRLPGGGTYYKSTSKGKQYKANNLITWKEYMIGLVVKEINASDRIEMLKFQMLLGQTYALNRLFSGESSAFYYNSAGELEITVGECTQSYNYKRYSNTYLNGIYKNNLDEAYDEIAYQVLINNDTGEIIYARYEEELQKQIRSMSKLTYFEMLNSNYIRNYSVGYYKNAAIKECDYTGANLPSSDSAIASIALSYVGKDTGKDCSGFTRLVLRKAGYIASFNSGYCEGDSRGSYGMYLTMEKNDRLSWKRSSGISTSAAMSTFPGNCAPGDLVFYSQGNDTCVRHVAVYIGEDNGTHMIVDTTESRHTAEYRSMTALGNNWIPLACARPY